MWSSVCDVWEDDKMNSNETVIKKKNHEQWFCQLSTNAKARWIAYQIYYATKCDVYGQNRKDWTVKDWEEWLKAECDTTD